MGKTLERKQNASSEESGTGMSSLQAPAQGPSACRRFIWSRWGQQVVEYGLLLAAISAAMLAMFVYGRRGLQSIIRETTVSEIGTQVHGSPTVGVESSESSRSRMFTLSHDGSHSNYTRGESQYDFDSWSSTTGESNAITSTVTRDDGSVVAAPDEPTPPHDYNGTFPL